MRAIMLAVLLAVMLAGCGSGPAPADRHGFYYGQEQQRPYPPQEYDPPHRYRRR